VDEGGRKPAVLEYVTPSRQYIAPFTFVWEWMRLCSVATAHLGSWVAVAVTAHYRLVLTPLVFLIIAVLTACAMGLCYHEAKDAYWNYGNSWAMSLCLGLNSLAVISGVLTVVVAPIVALMVLL